MLEALIFNNDFLYNICFDDLYQILVLLLFLFYFMLLLGFRTALFLYSETNTSARRLFIRGCFIEVLVAQRSILLNPFSVSFINHLKFGPPIDAGPQKPISEKHLGQQKMLLPALPVLIYSEAPHLLHGTGLQIWIVNDSQNKGLLQKPHESSYIACFVIIFHLKASKN